MLWYQHWVLKMNVDNDKPLAYINQKSCSTFLWLSSLLLAFMIALRPIETNLSAGKSPSC